MMLRRGMLMAGGLPTGIKKIATGTTTINASTDKITVTTGFGSDKPDYAAIWVDNSSLANQPNGSCVKSFYSLQKWADASIANPGYMYGYLYKHPTSGNILVGQYNPNGTGAAGTDTFTFSRGSNDWASTDTNGDPIVYRWYALVLDDNT